MKAIVLNTTQSRLNKRMEAITLKAGFLLCDEVYMAGNTCFELFIRETCNKFSMERKLGLVASWYKDDPEVDTLVQEARNILKLTKKAKYKQAELIVFLKKMEKYISDMLAVKLDEFDERFDDAGFQALRALKKDPRIQSYDLNSNQETPLYGVTASCLLQRLLPSVKEDEEPEVFFLGAEFFRDSAINRVYHSYNSEEASDIHNLVLHHCFTLPNINALSSVELESVYQQLRKSAATFTDNMNEWIDMCHFDDPLTDRNQFFRDTIIPAATHVQKAISQNEILTMCSRMQNDEVKLNVWIGEMPVWNLWDYYKEFEVIGEETWEKLQALKETDAYKEQRWPVAILDLPAEKVSEDQQNPEIITQTEIQATRKYLSID